MNDDREQLCIAAAFAMAKPFGLRKATALFREPAAPSLRRLPV
jgi:hypothetical protein